MKTITIEYKGTKEEDNKKLKCIIDRTTKLSDLIPEITATFPINLSDYFLVFDSNYESFFSLRDKCIEENDIIMNKVQDCNTFYLVKKSIYEVMINGNNSRQDLIRGDPQAWLITTS